MRTNSESQSEFYHSVFPTSAYTDTAIYASNNI